MAHAVSLSEDSIDDLLYAARAPDIDFLKESLTELSSHHQASELDIVAAAIDAQTGNGLAHYAAANGCMDILTHILSFSASPTTTTSPSPKIDLITRPNTALNTPLHYASLNGHLAAAQLLIERLTPLAPGQAVMEYLTAKNAAGHDAAYEAEAAERESVVNWLLGMMDQIERGIRGENGSGAGGDVEQAVNGEEVEGKEEEEEDVEIMRVRVGEMDVDEK